MEKVDKDKRKGRVLERAAVDVDHNDVPPMRVKREAQEMNRPKKRPSRVPLMIRKFHALDKDG